MRVLVTGSSGRVGRRVAAELLARGDEVAGLDLAPPPFGHAAFQATRGAFDDAEAIVRAIAGCDAVLHLGALMSWVEADAGRLFAANVAGTFTVLQAAAQAGVRRFVFASTGEVYPEVKPQRLPIDETHPTEPASLYGMSKLCGEEMVRTHARRYGLDFAILRFSHTQDAEELLDPDSFFSGPRFFLGPRIRQQERVGNRAVVDALRPHDDGTLKLLLSRGADGTPFRGTILDTRDLAAGILLALDSPAWGGVTVNLHPDASVRFDDLVPKMARLTLLPVVDVRLPGPAVAFDTSNARARALGFAPRFTIDDMLETAAAAWRRRLQGRTT